MNLPVLTAMSRPQQEVALVAALGSGQFDVEVVRRCVDSADLLAAAAAGLGRVALVSADLRGLDGEAIARLAGSGVAVVGMVDAGDEPAERRLRQLGVNVVVAADASGERVAAAARTAVLGVTDAVPAQPVGDRPPPTVDEDIAPGRIVAVWGPTGAPGRSTVAAGIAAEAAAHQRTLLVDADVYGAVQAQLLGILDESPGLAAACRLANNGALDVAGLAELATELRPGLLVLTGIARSDRWPELRPAAMTAVLELARRLCPLVVVDCGFCLEQDEELSYDTLAPRRNGATLAVLESADVVVAVAAADPIGVQRFVRGLDMLREVAADVEIRTVVNRVRRGPTGPGDPHRELSAAFATYAGISDLHFVPEDRAGVDAALAAGRTLAEAAPASPARLALRQLAGQLVGRPVPASRRRLLRRH